MPLCDGSWFRFWCTRLRGFYELFVVIPVLLVLSQTLWNHELFRIGFLEVLRKPHPFWSHPEILLLWRSLGRDPLWICSRGRYEAFLQVSSDLDVICSRFVVWRLVHEFFWVPTGQTGQQDRSDRSSRVHAPTGQTGPLHRSDRSRQTWLLFSRFVSYLLLSLRSLVLDLLCWFSFSIAIPNFGQYAWGLGWFWDIGRRVEFREKFWSAHIHPPLVAGFGPSTF